MREIRPGLFVYTAPPVFPLGRSFLTVNGINQRIVFNGVRRALGKLEMKKPIVWISEPYFSFFSRDWGQALTVFDWIHDDPGNAGSRLARAYRRLREETLEGSDLVFTPSRIIYERYGRNDPRFHLVPHGALLNALPAAPARKPEDISGIPSPIIGFIGTIGPSVDLELIEFLARGKKEWSFVFIGEIRRNVLKLKLYPNVYFLGPRTREELPRYLGCFSAGIIPYAMSPATETVHPVKTYEYLAAGIPVVSTRLPELEPLSEAIELVDNGNDFIRSVEKALAENTPDKIKRRRNIALENSWESRMNVIENAIAKALTSAGADRGFGISII